MYQSAAKNQPQLTLFSPADEASLYHEGRRFGYFTLNTRQPDERMRQRAYRLDTMPKVLDLLNPNIDSWISQGEFIKPNRRVVNLARMGLLFVDLDYYKVPEFWSLSPEAMLWTIWHALDDAGLPLPSLVISSGQGLQLKWLLDKPLPRQALPRWNACQRALVDALLPYGADPKAKDASRILRVVQTVNSRSGEQVRVIHAPGFRYNFEEMAETLLPFERTVLEEQRKLKEKRKSKLKVLDGGKRDGLRGFSSRQLAWHRLEDLRKLADLRGGACERQRTLHLFWRLNFLLLSGATNSNQMWHEAASLAREIDPTWGYRSPELSTLYTKAQAAERGETVEFGGHSWTPLYTPKNQTLIDQFKIKPDEERQLRTIVSKGEAARRHRDREAVRRRSAGAVPRAEYEAKSISRQKPWEALGMSRAKWYRLGKPTP